MTGLPDYDFITNLIQEKTFSLNWFGNNSVIVLKLSTVVREKNLKTYVKTYFRSLNQWSSYILKIFITLYDKTLEFEKGLNTLSTNLRIG